MPFENIMPTPSPISNSNSLRTPRLRNRKSLKKFTPSHYETQLNRTERRGKYNSSKNLRRRSSLAIFGEFAKTQFLQLARRQSFAAFTKTTSKHSELFRLTTVTVASLIAYNVANGEDRQDFIYMAHSIAKTPPPPNSVMCVRRRKHQTGQKTAI